ncbi:MAG: DUF3153 domain-containing protein [Leptolyngbyaceae cyanobacterium SM2_3_12]|nr:DUF3153 domain-containing protein [Leptolyngbyaceae cyanobacterium SM2_3_12]
MALLPLVLLLSGCLQYDLTLRFDHRTHGQISQTFRLDERGAALAQSSIDPWVEELKPRVRQLGGHLNRSEPGTVDLVVPFSTGRDLVSRFDQLFADTSFDNSDHSLSTIDLNPDQAESYLTLPNLGTVPFRLEVNPRNWGLASYTHLTYDIDLRDLPPSPSVQEEDSNQRDWAALRFGLQVPWGISQVLPQSTVPQSMLPNGAYWRLKSGELNHIDVAFWLPNAVGLGTVGIVIAVLLGYFLRYRVLKRPRLS